VAARRGARGAGGRLRRGGGRRFSGWRRRKSLAGKVPRKRNANFRSEGGSWRAEGGRADFAHGTGSFTKRPEAPPFPVGNGVLRLVPEGLSGRAQRKRHRGTEWDGTAARRKNVRASAGYRTRLASSQPYLRLTTDSIPCSRWSPASRRWPPRGGHAGPARAGPQLKPESSASRCTARGSPAPSAGAATLRFLPSTGRDDRSKPAHPSRPAVTRPPERATARGPPSASGLSIFTC